MYARLSSGYDFRTYRDHSVGFRQRVQPITAEVNWQASQKLAFTVHEDYQLDEGNRAFLADIHWGDEEGNAAGGSVFHNDSDPTLYYGSLKFAVAPSSPTWRVAASSAMLVDGITAEYTPTVVTPTPITSARFTAPVWKLDVRQHSTTTLSRASRRISSGVASPVQSTSA